jgi:iron complex outermembrane recepter protein
MFYSDNFGGTLNFASRRELFGQRNILTIGLSPQFEDEHSQNYENLFGHTGATTARGEGISVNVPVYLEDQFYVAPQLSIIAGAQAIFAERHFIDEFLTDADGNQSNRQNFWGFNPKLGAIYEINRQIQAFMNLSRSWQPPSLDNLVDFDEGPNSSVVYTPLSPQHAWTIKVGTRGEYSRFEWELSFYRSWFRNELLEVNDAFGNDIGTRNVPRTNHQGIEASLEVELLRDILMPKQSNRAGDRLSLDRAIRSTISISIRTLFTATIASRESRFTFMKRNCFTKARLVSMPARTCSVIFRVIQLMRRTRSLRIVMCCLVFVRDFDGATGSQSLSIAGT